MIPEISHTACSAPPPLTDDELFSVLDDEADPGVMEHLAMCRACSERLTTFLEAERAFKQTLYRFECPSSLELVEYQSGDMPESSANNIAQHLKGCPRCRTELDGLNALDQREASASVPVLPLLPFQPNALSRRRRSNPAARYPQLPLRFQPSAHLSPGAALRGDVPLTLDVSLDELLITLNLKRLPGSATLSGVLVTDDPAQETQWHGALVQCSLNEKLIGQKLLDTRLSFEFVLVGDAPAPISLYIIATDGTTLALEDMTV